MRTDKTSTGIFADRIRFGRNRIYFGRILFLPALLLTLAGAASCLDDDSLEEDNTYMGNFKACWTAMNEHYCFFEEKGVDWDAVYEAYYPYFRDSVQSAVDEFELMASMLATVRDGHVNLYSAFNTARYWKWYEDYPDNFDENLLYKYYLGSNYWLSSGIYYGMFADTVAYMWYPSFSTTVSESTLDYVLAGMRQAKGLIIDVRNNGGGTLTNVPVLANRFCTQKTVYSYMKHKTGKGHSDFSEPEPLYLEPQEDRYNWDASVQPVVVLTNRSCYSATNNFVAAMRALDGTLSLSSKVGLAKKNIKIMGDRTGGGGGLPFESVLPNGWILRFSACPILDHEMNQTEDGIAPDYQVSMDSVSMYYYHADDIIESARAYIRYNTRMKYGTKAQ